MHTLLNISNRALGDHAAKIDAHTSSLSKKVTNIVKFKKKKKIKKKKERHKAGSIFLLTKV